MNKHTWIIGFTLFAMFFGAGNLIFPPNLGQKKVVPISGSNFSFLFNWNRLTITRVVVGALDKQGYIGAFNKLSPRFSVVFLIIIYLTIGPLFAIPRTASTSF